VKLTDAEQATADRCMKAVDKAIRGCVSSTLDATLAAFPEDLTMIRAIIRDAGKEVAIDGIVSLFEEAGKMKEVRKDMASSVADMYETFKDDGPLGPRAIVTGPVESTESYHE